MSILASLLVLVAGGGSSLVNAPTYQACGMRRAGAAGPELVDRDGRVVVETAYLVDVEKGMRLPASDGVTYCVSFRRELGMPKPIAISQLSCAGLPVRTDV